MESEPTITDEQRAEWTAWMESWRHLSTVAGFEEMGATVFAFNDWLTWLETDHARLVEENRRLREALTDISRNEYHRDTLWEICHEALTSPEAIRE